MLNARCMAGFGLRGADTHPTDIDAHGVRVATADTHLYGFFDPKPVPAEGCKAQAQQGTGGELPNMSAAGLPDGGPTTPLSDPRVLDATKKWSACMTGKGYHP